jgi:hypothetical protein
MTYKEATRKTEINRTYIKTCEEKKKLNNRNSKIST